MSPLCTPNQKLYPNELLLSGLKILRTPCELLTYPLGSVSQTGCRDTFVSRQKIKYLFIIIIWLVLSVYFK
jgi:hypothetical protein